MAQAKQDSFFVWRIVHLIFAVFFFLACFVNKNDADWYLWMPIYCTPGLLCVSAAIKPSLTGLPAWHSLATLLFYGCFLYAIYGVFALSMVFTRRGVQNPFSLEEGRELGGLTIIVTWAGIALSPSAKKSSHESSGRSLLSTAPWVMASLATIPLAYWSLCFIPGLGSSMGHCIGMKSC